MRFGDSRRTRGSRRRAGHVRELGRGPRQPGKLPQRSCGPRNGPCYDAQSTYSTNMPKVTGWLWGDCVVLRPGPPVFTCTTDAEWVAQTAKQKFALREPAFPAILKKKSYKNCVPKICGPRHLFTLEPPICDGNTVFSSRHLWRVESSSPLAHRFGIMVLRFGIMGKSGENNPLSSFSLCAGHTGFPDPELRW